MNQTTDAAVTVALEQARTDVVDATRRARRARIAAIGPLRARARCRSRMLRWGLVVSAVVAVLLVAARIVLAVMAHSADEHHRVRNDVLADARTAVTVLLTSDPAQPGAYVERALSVTTGGTHRQLDGSRQEVTAAVAGAPPATGVVLSAGLQTDPPTDAPGATAEVLLVAQASDPGLFGLDATSDRVMLSITMSRVGDPPSGDSQAGTRWRISWMRQG